MMISTSAAMPTAPAATKGRDFLILTETAGAASGGFVKTDGGSDIICCIAAGFGLPHPVQKRESESLIVPQPGQFQAAFLLSKVSIADLI